MRGVVGIALIALGCGGGPGAATDGGGLDAGRAVDAGRLDAGRDAGAPTDGGPADIGDPCTMDSDCPGPNERCLTSTVSFVWPDFPGGYCTQTSCTFGVACSPTSTCQPLPGVGPHCFVNCTSDADCRVAEGYHCQMHPFASPGMMYCFPPDARDGG